MKRLPTVRSKDIWSWGVCREYRDSAHLDRVTSGRVACDAEDVLKLPIRDVDKLWVLLRTEMLPVKVLERVSDRITAVLPSDPDAAPDGTARERGRLIAKRRKAQDYWGVSRHTTAVLDRLNLSVPTDEHARQITILTEEIRRWLKEK
jgi:hypothetical protein